MKRTQLGWTGIMAAWAAALLCGCVMTGQQASDNTLAQIEKNTGLKIVQVPNTTNVYLGKNHRGYEVLYHAQAGNVCGRYAARLTAGEIGREAGGLLSFLTGSYESGVGGVTGSPFDRLLSKIIGQPLSVMISLKHGKRNAPRLDVLSGYSVIKPEDPLPKRAHIGFKAGDIYAQDEAFAGRLSENQTLMKRMAKMRCQYIRVDSCTVTFFWAGSETDYSGMISDHGGYYPMINGLMDTLADIADAIPQ